MTPAINHPAQRLCAGAKRRRKSMKVSELPYRRVTLEEVKAVMEDVIPRIRSANSVEEILAAREDYLKANLE